MKIPTQLVAGLLLGAAAFSSFAQGTVNFNNHIVGTLVTHVYGPDLENPNLILSGNGSDDTPSGTTVYGGVPIGGSSIGGPGTLSNGNRFTAQLWALTGTGNPASSLQAVTQYTTTFRTQAGLAGFFTPVSPSPDPGIPNTGGGIATLQLRVWDNQGGTVPDWASALTTVGDAHGASPTFDLSNLGGVGSPPNQPPNLIGLQSFSLDGRISPTPEPSTMVLITLGGVWLGFFRRKKT